ncbi:MAG: fasciclin domain-containing protein [Vulcanimicrobiaceae bacterium]
MNFRTSTVALAAAVLLGSTMPAFAAEKMDKMDKMDKPSMSMQNPMVGGHAMFANKDIVSNAVTSDDNKTLVAAVKAAGLVSALQGPGPLTVFAPTDEAFAALPAGTVDTLVKPENKATLTKILTYHVVAGKLDFKALAELIEDGKGKASLKTLQGETLALAMNGPRNITLTDSKGNVAHISTYDVYQSNGVIQVIDRVLMP